jgi:hypothetical protein
MMTANKLTNSALLAGALASTAVKAHAQQTQSTNAPVVAAETKIEKEPALPFSVSATLSPQSHYMLRGYTITDNPVIQPTLTLARGHLAATGFWNYDTKAGNITEASLFVDATKQFNKTTLGAGYEFITQPNTDFHDTHAVSGSASFELSPFRPNLKVVYDFAEGKGIYAEAGIGFAKLLTERLSFDSSASLSYNLHWFRERSGLSHATFSAGLPLNLSKHFSVAPRINYQHSLDSDFADKLYGGLTLSVNF